MIQFKNHALHVDEKTLEQLTECLSHPFVVDAALMPDAHAGYVAPIGSVLKTKDYIVPSWVGFDIGCGMTAVQITTPNILEKIQTHITTIYAQVQKQVPMGMGKLNQKENVTTQTLKELKELFTMFESNIHQKQDSNFIKSASYNHLGTLGDGNHFIELCTDDAQHVWIVVHCGSRGIGYKLAQKYMKIAAKTDTQFEKTYPLHQDSQEGKEYRNILHFGLSFALLNRMEIIRKTLLALETVLQTKLSWEVWTNKNHNHALFENGFWIHRKGATPAKKGERGVIPGSMKDGSFLVEGLGNDDFLQSSSHGAGRIMGRAQAKRELDVHTFKEDMKGIVGTISQETLDESPRAYKNIYEVMDLQKESVRVLNHLRPLINWKGTKNHG